MIHSGEPWWGNLPLPDPFELYWHPNCRCQPMSVEERLNRATPLGPKMLAMIQEINNAFLADNDPHMAFTLWEIRHLPEEA